MSSPPRRANPISPELRARLVKQQQQMHRAAEADFEYHLDLAKWKLPVEAKNPFFPFIIRMLWRPHALYVPPNWFEALPHLYADFCEQNAWALERLDIRGQLTDPGVKSLARLLLAMRKRQRRMEGAAS